jgi:hypothetical protein
MIPWDKEVSNRMHDYFKVYTPMSQSNPVPVKMEDFIGIEMKNLSTMVDVLFSKHSFLKDFNQSVITASITVKDFNAAYAKFAKYAYQAVFTEYEDFPDSEVDFHYLEKFLGVSSFKQFRDKVSIRTTEIPCSDFFVRGEILVPWEEDLPTAIEILEEENPSPAPMSYDEFKEIISKIIQKTSRVYTMSDFVISQTNTHKVVYEKGLSDYIEKVNKNPKKKSNTKYKYCAIPKYFDDGCPNIEDFAVRTPTYKRPTEYRDAITCNINTVISVWKFNKILTHSYTPEFQRMQEGISADPWTKVHEFTKRNHDGYFTHTDFKKSGLTMPHWFIKMLLRFVNEMNPEMDISFPTDGWPIYDPKTGKIFRPKDFGYGLGMINEAYTIFGFFNFQDAKNQDIFDEESTMLSFNDDSVVAHQNEVALARWFNLISKNGGWVDRHKSYCTKLGAQFLEIFSNRSIKTNAKLLSMCSTIFKTYRNSHNYHHWRHVISASWASLRKEGRTDVTKESSTQLEYFYMSVIRMVKSNSLSVWSCPVIIGDEQINPRGINLIPMDEIRAGMLDTLIEIEDCQDIKTRTIYQNTLRSWKDTVDTGIVFRPWEVFPDGKTKETFKRVGALKGFTNELSSLTEKAKSKFILERGDYLIAIWNKVQSRIEANFNITEPDLQWWDWASSKEWGGYRIPLSFISEWDYTIDSNIPIPWLKDGGNKETVKYTLGATFVDLASVLAGEPPAELPMEEIDLSKHFSTYVPLVNLSSGYTMLNGFDFMSALSGFMEPRVAFEDLRKRKGAVPKTFTFKRELGREMIEFMRRCNPEKYGDPSYIGATWWTKLPLPYTEEQRRILECHPPHTHDIILSMWDEKSLGDYATPEGFFHWELEENQVTRSREKQCLTTPSSVIDLRLRPSRLKYVEADFRGHNTGWGPEFNGIKIGLSTILSEQTDSFLKKLNEAEDGIALNLMDQFESTLQDNPDWVVKLEDAQNPYHEDSDYEIEEEDENDLALQYAFTKRRSSFEERSEEEDSNAD